MRDALSEIVVSVGAKVPIIEVSTPEPVRIKEEIVSRLEIAYPDAEILVEGDLSWLEGLERLNSQDEGDLIFVSTTVGYYLDSPECYQALLGLIGRSKEPEIRTLVVLGRCRWPEGIERAVRLVDYPLPSEEELRDVLERFCTANGISFKSETKERIAKIAKGLTVLEFQNSLGIALLKSESFSEDSIIRELKNQKEQLIKKSEILSLFHPEDLDEIQGLDTAREFIKRAVSSGLGKGSFLLGVPGTGKTLLAKTVGKELNLPIVIFNVEGVFSKYVGESEQRVREALKTVEAVAPCILVVDEIEKALAHGNGDSGTSTRVFGTFLKWLNDRKAPVYVIATANDVFSLPPEFLRAERWDAMFWVDVPDLETLRRLLDYYSGKYSLSPEMVDVKVEEIEGYTGAEVKSLCRIAAMLDVPLSEALKYVKPVVKTMGERLGRIRKLAEKVCVPAGSIVLQSERGKQRGRMVVRKPAERGSNGV